mmetsp:Transcript_2865/g.5807  ORF Transcript_2865/g.5807 Transcript_2865/m.5807 type:complete len:166 (-) Transcript_2865:72-569(-)
MSQSNAKRGGKGAVGSKLSDKFAKLSSSTTASTGRKNRKTAVVSNQKSNRNTQSNAKRGLAEKKMNVKGSAGAKPQGRRGGKGGNKLAPKRDSGKKQQTKTSDDLDMEMDSYWFAAGKGPDPVAASLDKEMDSYFDSKKGFEEQGASQEEVPKTEEVPAATSETA